jgi:hypothetical protein
MKCLKIMQNPKEFFFCKPSVLLVGQTKKAEVEVDDE